jgi:hypothetical protein
MATPPPDVDPRSLLSPAPLHLNVPSDDDVDIDIESNDDEFPRSSGPPSPLALSPTALELIPEPDGSPDAALFDFSDDDDDDDNVPAGLAGALTRLSTGPIPPLPPLRVLLFALAPSLRLGAFLLPYEATPLVKAIPASILFAGMAALARQIWYMLARYVGTADVETVVAMTFARAPRKVKARRFLRIFTRTATGLFRVLLATIYLRGSLPYSIPCCHSDNSIESVDAVLPHLPRHLFTSRLPLTIIIALFLIPLAWTSSIGAKRIAVTSWFSLALYIAWFSFAAVAHGKGLLSDGIPPEGRGRLWDDIRKFGSAREMTRVMT